MDEIPIINNLKFHRADYRQSMRKLYAFVTCIDVQADGKGKFKKHYWGEVSSRDNAEDIIQIMQNGGKWKNLP